MLSSFQLSLFQLLAQPWCSLFLASNVDRQCRTFRMKGIAAYSAITHTPLEYHTIVMSYHCSPNAARHAIVCPQYGHIYGSSSLSPCSSPSPSWIALSPSS
ncbi:hypothetical protein QR685DRAFT_434643 [Neurospora intermedia]|uniref:Secreted protein n=1 Tax=Neurospora intermedia TaxID=5142 RepID=A0ABR3DNX1_NEUIN